MITINILVSIKPHSNIQNGATDRVTDPIGSSKYNVKNYYSVFL